MNLRFFYVGLKLENRKGEEFNSLFWLVLLEVKTKAPSKALMSIRKIVNYQHDHEETQNYTPKVEQKGDLKDNLKDNILDKRVT